LLPGHVACCGISHRIYLCQLDIELKYIITEGLSTEIESRKWKLMQFASQIRAARALLGWSQSKLAGAAGVGLATLQRIEQSDGVVKGNFATVLKIQKTLEDAGICFTDDEAGEIGVRLLRKK
jgi:DNA-binding XRE family transcriptional regulator